MTSVRQAVTTVQASSSAVPAALDNSLDALLEDLQTSVSRPPSSAAMNGLAPSPVSRSYREVRTFQEELQSQPDNYHHVQHLSAANPTTVVSERAISPGRMMQPGEQRSAAYKQVSYQYNTRETQPAILESSSVSDPASDARLRQNLNELDNLLVDLHHAQKTGFSTDQVTSTGSVQSGKGGIDPGLLEDISSTSPGRPGQHMSRVVEQRTYTTRYVDQPGSPPLQPKRSSSAQRELTYGTIEPRQESPRTSRRTVSRDVYQHETKGSTPPRSQYRDKSPSNQRLHREMYYDSNKTSRVRDPSPPAPKRGVSPGPVDGYPGSKVTTVRTYTSTTGGIPPSPAEPYPGSKVTTVRTYADSPVPLDNYSSTKIINNTRTYTGESPTSLDNSYPPHVTTVRESPIPSDNYPTTKITTVRTYTGDSTLMDNYPPNRPRESPVPVEPYPGTNTKITTVRTYTGDSTLVDNYPPNRPREPPVPVEPYPGTNTKYTTVRTYTGDSTLMDNYPPNRPREPPVPVDPYPGTNTKITTVRTYTNVVPGGRSPSPVTELPKPAPYRSPSPVQFQPPQPPQPKVTTTVRTYTYELPGDKPHHPYPPGDYPDHPVTYHQSPQPEREPLIGPPEPTIITYKYSSHSSHHTNSKFPTGPGVPAEDREPLLPRPFPTASPGSGDSQPPKRLDELMASFSDTEVEERRPLPTPTYHVTERQASMPRQVPGPPHMPPQGSEVAVVSPTPAKATSIERQIERQMEQRRGQTKNVAGPPVYYPPGVELFTRKDQSMQMASMKGSGKYEMSRESQSQNKSSSGGAAVVPVCLPLCCAMPCVIM